jgi:hypothetical protein
MKKDRQEGAWKDFSRLFERYFLKGKIESLEEENGLLKKVSRLMMMRRPSEPISLP